MIVTGNKVNGSQIRAQQRLFDDMHQTHHAMERRIEHSEGSALEIVEGVHGVFGRICDQIIVDIATLAAEEDSVEE